MFSEYQGNGFYDVEVFRWWILASSNDVSIKRSFCPIYKEIICFDLTNLEIDHQRNNPMESFIKNSLS